MIVLKWLSITAAMVLVLIAPLLIYLHVGNTAEDYIYRDVQKLPVCKVGVVLGTSSRLKGGSRNTYFEQRMNAAYKLLESNKVSYLLVSGDNRTLDYNEPQAMYDALVKRGVPKEKIIFDYAGFRTLDSMVRAKKVFGQQRFIVISQRFHNERAVYIARHFQIEAYAYDARDVETSAGFRTRLREMLARVKMILDLYILNTQPHFLGEEISIG